MRPTDNVEKLVEQMNFSGSEQLHERILNKTLDANTETAGKPVFGRPNILRFVTIGRITIAAALIIIAAVWCIFKYPKSTEQIEPLQTIQISKPQAPSELTSAMSLNAAFRKGGMQAFEQKLAETGKQINQCPQERITIEKLLCDLGLCEEI